MVQQSVPEGLDSQRSAFAPTYRQSDDLLSVRLSKLIDDDEYTRRRRAIDTRVTKLKGQIENVGRTREERRSAVMEVSSMSVNVLRLLDSGTRASKRRVLRSVCSNLELYDKRVLVTVKKPFQQVQSAIGNATSNGRMIEPEEFGDLKPHNVSSNGANPVWWTVPESNR